jgi:Rod binding domain-containing protein
MSTSLEGATGLPVVNQALEPEWVRHGSASTQKAYETALEFEQTLVEQLSKSMAASSGLGGESSQEEGAGEEGGSSASDSEISSMLPQALTSSVMSAGGLGLAAQLSHQIEGLGAGAQAHASGATSPNTTANASTGGAATASSGGAAA